MSQTLVTSDNLPDPTGPGTGHAHREELNSVFLVDEINDAIKNVKIKKACVIDQIRNEFRKPCSPQMLTFITELLNFVLETGIVPTEWCIGMIVLYRYTGIRDKKETQTTTGE